MGAFAATAVAAAAAAPVAAAAAAAAAAGAAAAIATAAAGVAAAAAAASAAAQSCYKLAHPPKIKKPRKRNFEQHSKSSKKQQVLFSFLSFSNPQGWWMTEERGGALRKKILHSFLNKNS